MVYLNISIAAWVDVSWAQNMSSKSNNDTNSPNVEVVDISDPSVEEAMLKAERLDKNASNKNNKTPSTGLDNTLKQVVLSFGKKSTEQESGSVESKDDNNEGEKQQQEGGEGRIDLANLQFLMAVEDLLDSSQSDLFANALAEAASLRVDQLRTATQSFRNTLLASPSGNSGPMPSAQGSRESQSPPNELSVQVTSDPPPSATATVESQSEKETAETPKENTTEGENSSSKADFELSKEECLNQIQKISSSMSEVFDSMAMATTNTEVVEMDVDNQDGFSSNDENSAALNVAENNFLNDNHCVMDSNVISMLKEDDITHSNHDDDDDDNDDFDDDEFDDDDEVCDGESYEHLTEPTEVKQYVEPKTEVSIIDKEKPESESTDINTEKHNREDSPKEPPVSDAQSTPSGISRDVLASMLQVLTGNNENSVENLDDITQQALRLLSGGQSSDETSSAVVKETSSAMTSDSLTTPTKTDNSGLYKQLDQDAESISNILVTRKADVPDPSQSNHDDTVTPVTESTMKTPEAGDTGGSNLDDEDSDTMYTLQEILDAHKISRMVAEKEKKFALKRGNAGDESKKDSEWDAAPLTTSSTTSTSTTTTTTIEVNVKERYFIKYTSFRLSHKALTF